jgi:hypothetical protein
MAWNPASGRFPLLGQTISMSQIRAGFITAGYTIPTSYNLSTLVGKMLFNTDGSTFLVPAITPSTPLALSYFYGKYFLNTSPYAAAITVPNVIPYPPVSPPRPTPTGFSFRLVGGGGGGGGSGGGYKDLLNIVNNVGGPGGGGGGGGLVNTPIFSFVSNTLSSINTILPTFGNAGGGGNGGAGVTSYGTPGQSGGNATVTYNGTSYIAYGGSGGAGGANGTVSGTGSGQAGGLGGGGLNGTITPGQNGRNGGDPFSLTGGEGGVSYDPPISGLGGKGGNSVEGGSQAGVNARAGSIYIIWYFT